MSSLPPPFLPPPPSSHNNVKPPAPAHPNLLPSFSRTHARTKSRPSFCTLFTTPTHSCNIYLLYAVPSYTCYTCYTIPQNLAQRAYIPLKNGAVTPKGWLLKQLKLQAEGLSGHLSMFWNDIQNSIWVGGKGDGGLHERAPYWLNGIVPLASLLQNAGEEMLAGTAGIYKSSSVHDGPLPPVNITEQAWKYVNAMRGSQDAKGWLGPTDNPKDGNAYWGRSNVILSLAMFAEANPSEFTNVSEVMLKYECSDIDDASTRFWFTRGHGWGG